MTAIDELADLVRTTSEAASAPPSWASGATAAGTGFVVAPGQGAHQRPQPARPRRPRSHFADGRVGAGRGRRQRRRRRPRRARRRHRRRRAAASGPTTPSATGRRRRRRDRRPPPPARRVGPGHGDRGRRSAARAAARSSGALEHTAPCGAGLVGRAGARPRRAASSASTRTASSTASTSPAPSTRRCATAVDGDGRGSHVRAGPPRRGAGAAARRRPAARVGRARRARRAARARRRRRLAGRGGRHPGGRPARRRPATATCATPGRPVRACSATSRRAVSWRSRWCAAPRS